MSKPISYSTEELEWVRANSQRPRADAHAEFVERFGRDDVSLKNLNSLCKRNGWQKRAQRKPITYTADELKWIQSNCTRPRAEAHAEFVERFDRQDVAFENYHALCKRKGWRTGRDGRFVEGREPPNKGKKCAPGTGGRHPNAQRTQFKKGDKPFNVKPVGHERLTEDGYVLINIDEVNPHTGYGRRYVLKHVHLWERENGPVPEGMCLKSLDGDRSNSNPSNWTLIPRSALPKLTRKRRYDDAPDELKPTIMAVTLLEHTAETVGNPPREHKPLGRKPRSKEGEAA